MPICSVVFQNVLKVFLRFLYFSEVKISCVGNVRSGKCTNDRKMVKADLITFVLLFLMNLECIKRSQQVQQEVKENIGVHLQQNKRRSFKSLSLQSFRCAVNSFKMK